MPRQQNPKRESYSELKRRQLDDVDAVVEFEEGIPVNNTGTNTTAQFNIESTESEQDYFDRLHVANAHGLQLLKLFTNTLRGMEKNTYERELFGAIIARAELDLRAKLLEMLTEEHKQIEAFTGEENG